MGVNAINIGQHVSTEPEISVWKNPRFFLRKLLSMNLYDEDTAYRTLGHEYLREGINFVSWGEAREME